LAGLFDFVIMILNNPNVLLNANLRNKNRAAKIENAFEMIKLFQSLDQGISIKGLRDVRPFIKFDRANFIRSSEYLQAFTCSTMSDKCFAAVIVGRNLQVYNYVSGKIFFEMKMPNAAMGQKTISLQFIDNDNILVLKDSNYRLVFVNVPAQIEAYDKKNNHEQAKDLTFKIEGPIVIETDFAAENDQLEQEDKNSEDSDQNESKLSKKLLETDKEIKGVFCSRSMAELANVAIVSHMKFTIYFASDDQAGCVDVMK